MKIGTKSILFGVHCWFIHPWFVALAWWKLYGFPWDIRLWVCFFVHDLGYWGMPNIDGEEGERHPWFGARLVGRILDNWNLPDNQESFNADLWTGNKRSANYWQRFCLYHSRFLAKKYGTCFSPLCVADKLSMWLVPRWLYLIQANLTGEIHEYMKGQGARMPAGERSQWQWITDVQRYVRDWAYEHKDGKQDLWTGTKRDLAIETKI